MAKAMRNRAKDEAKLLETRAALVLVALDAGKFTRRAICKATGMKAHELSSLFTKDRKIFAEYTVRRKTLADTAADNIAEIVNDPNHPKNFEASKWMLTNYKSDLDDTLTPAAGEMEIQVPQGQEQFDSGAAPVIIKFSAPTKKD